MNYKHYKIKTIQIKVDKDTYDKFIKIKKKVSNNYYDFIDKIIEKGEEW